MVLHPGGCGRVGHRRTTIKKVESPNQTPVGALPHLTHHSHRPQAPTSTSGPEPFKSRRRPDVPASVGGYRPGRRQPAAVPAAAPAVPRPRSWRSFLPHVQRPARGRAGVPVAGLSLPMTGGAPVRNFTQQVPGRFAGCGLWRLCLRMQGAGRRRAGSLDAGLSGGMTPGARGQHLPGQADMSRIVTWSIKLVRTPGGSVHRLAVPETRGNSRVSGRICASFGRVALGVGWV
jgi:hypothetical protein